MAIARAVPGGANRLFGDSGIFARLFEDRSGRIIAVTRFALAAVFYIALWVDPSQPVRSSLAGYIILFTYLVFAMGMAAIAWRSWWWDFRLAWPAHAIDILAFLAAVFFTESVQDDFTSPFLAFFAFLMLSATIRWDWRLTAATGLVAALLYLVVGLIMGAAGIELDQYRFGRRVVYMVVLAIILTWLGHQRRGQNVPRFVESPGSAEDALPPLDDALAYAMREIGARQGAIVWADHEEPQVELRTAGLLRTGGRFLADQVPGGMPRPNRCKLFDRPRERLLRARDSGGCVAERAALPGGLAQFCAIERGLEIPFFSVTGDGIVLLAQIPGPSADHVLKGGDIAREIGAGFDRHSTLSLVRESAMTLMRDTVARDLHDTIAQSLAGAALRLEALRTWIANGGEPDAEIQSIKAALKSEQVQVRGMINRLRAGEDASPGMTATQALAPMLRDLATYWDVDVDMAGSGSVLVPGLLVHELRQLVREAVANAVRHGGASAVAITLGQDANDLVVTISDNGSGFVPGPGAPLPRTISERIAQLGGRLDIASTPKGATLSFHLPSGAIQ